MRCIAAGFLEQTAKLPCPFSSYTLNMDDPESHTQAVALLFPLERIISNHTFLSENFIILL